MKNHTTEGLPYRKWNYFLNKDIKNRIPQDPGGHQLFFLIAELRFYTGLRNFLKFRKKHF